MKTSNQQNIKTCTFYVEGMHCAACELLIEDKLKKAEGVTFVDAVLGKGTVIVKGEFEKDSQELAKEFTSLVEKDGYTIHTEKVSKKKEIDWAEFLIAFTIAFALILGFISLQKFGIIDSLSPESINLPAIFLIGFIASLSSCAAVVGGLVLSLSANYAKESSKNKFTPQISFHISRLVSFFFLGGIIGLIGSAFTLSIELNFALSFIIALVMIILGLNLLDLFDFTKKLQFKMPKRFSKSVMNLENTSSFFAPVILGIITFFLPCGFTQSMQIYSLGTGNFFDGALTMFVFALGTLPVLALISFTSTKLSENFKYKGVFFKTAGFIVLFFAIVNFAGALAVMGIIRPIFGF